MTTKGFALEELLRAYFLKAGFFVVRGVPVNFEEWELTDVDLWLYERPSGTTRRIQIVDIKYKQRPKAIERLFWTSGLVKALGVDGGYVATTDKRKELRNLAKQLGLLVIDGTDIKRIKESQNIKLNQRLTDEELVAQLRAVDKARKNNELISLRKDILNCLSDDFGVKSTVRALECFSQLANSTVASHPRSDAAVCAGRLAYLAAAIACQSLDYVSVEAAFRSMAERRELLINAVRYGATDRDSGLKQLRLALGLIRKYSPSANISNAVEAALNQDLDAVPAEIIADQAVRLLKGSKLFDVGRYLENACYTYSCPPFDQLEPDAKSFIGATLDYAAVKRDTFATAWSLKRSNRVGEEDSQNRDDADQTSLFKS